jgi:hypothetical protein
LSTSSRRPAASITIGVLQPPRDFGSRTVFQTVLPVSRSSATSDDSPSASQFWITLPSTITGEAPTPHGPEKAPRSRDQRFSPSMSKACMPPGPKNATTVLPSVAQVGVAKPFIACGVSGCSHGSVRSHRIFPSMRLTQKT